ncbi:hypothetical protein D3C76_1645040 [compost metagenome]
MAQATKCLGRDAHSSVTDCPPGASELTRQQANLLGGHPAQWAHALSAERRNRLAYLLQAIDRQMRALGQILAEQGIEQAAQQRGVTAWTNEKMPISHVGCLAASRVDHHKPPAPRP